MQVDKSRSQELISHFYKGMGCHHAGMLRSDRTLTEQLFERGVIKCTVLYCYVGMGCEFAGAHSYHQGNGTI